MDSSITEKLRCGCVIPAHPLAIEEGGDIDERHQKALTRYYLAAGAGGLAVGVHTTQFAIHDAKVGLYRPVLELAAETTRQFTAACESDMPIMVAGIVGDTAQATGEAATAREIGYHLGLLSLTALRGESTGRLIEHCRRVAEVIPIMGFYLQQKISRMTLSTDFWSRFVEIPNVAAIKIAPFNRYQTLDVLEAVARSGRADEIALYTGNDDNIIIDLLTRWEFNIKGRQVSLHVAGGLLGQWACWTAQAVKILTRINTIRRGGLPIPPDLLTLAGQLTLANKVIFDADNDFAGCIPGISCVLKRQGLMRHVGTLDPSERLSPGQAEKIEGVIRDYPHLTDDGFVAENLDKWLSL